MDQAMAAIRPLVKEFILPEDRFTAEKRKISSLTLTYTDKNRHELSRLVEMFETKARQLGVDVNISASEDI